MVLDKTRKKNALSKTSMNSYQTRVQIPPGMTVKHQSILTK